MNSHSPVAVAWVNTHPIMADASPRRGGYPTGFGRCCRNPLVRTLVATTLGVFFQAYSDGGQGCGSGITGRGTDNGYQWSWWGGIVAGL